MEGSPMELIAEGGESSVYRVRPGLVLRRFEPQARERASVEWAVLRHLCAAGYPVPRPLGLVALEAGAIGLQMEEIEGPTAATALGAADPAGRPVLVAEWGRLLRQLHGVDLASIVWPEGTGLLGTMASFRAWLAPAAAAVLAPAFEWLLGRLATVQPLGPVLLHNDWHGQNIMLRPSGALVVIDWSAAGLGDPRVDLGYAVALQRMEGNEWAAEALLAGYGLDLPELALFEAQAALRRLGIFLSVLAEGPERLGLRPGLDAHLRETRDYLRPHLAFLEERSGLVLPAVAEAIERW
jgi:aminoglycoside phosphotransferase (APT) family kinase protein